MTVTTAPRTPESVTAEAAAIERGWAVYRRAQDAMWPESVRRTIAAAVMDLHGALDLYGYLLNDLIRPASVDGWDDLEHEPEAYAIGMERATRDVAEWTDELIRVFPACGDEGGEGND